jgi:Cu/Ag efflux protein CusF
MKKISLVLITLAMALLLITSNNAMAQEVKKIVGEITKIELSSDGKTAVVGIKDNKTQEVVEVIVNDEETLNKFKSYKIREGDEVRCRYEVKDGKNISKSLLRTAGC